MGRVCRKEKVWQVEKSITNTTIDGDEMVGPVIPPPSSPTEYIEIESLYSEVDKILAVEIARVHKRR